MTGLTIPSAGAATITAGKKANNRIDLIGPPSRF
jgi:hypothetical protein